MRKTRRRKPWVAPVVIPTDVVAALNACTEVDDLKREMARLSRWLDERHGAGAGDRMLMPMLREAGWTPSLWYRKVLTG